MRRSTFPYPVKKIMSWAMDGDVYHIHYGISCLSICGSSNGRFGEW